MSHPIRFKFDSEKLVRALAFFASRGVEDLDTLKSAKLLYFADRAHLLKYGRPIVGDDYYCMKNGPIPTNALGQIQDFLSRTPTGDHDERFANTFTSITLNNTSHLWTGRLPIFTSFQPTD